MGGDMAPLEVTDGAKTSIALATLPAAGPTGARLHQGSGSPMWMKAGAGLGRFLGRRAFFERKEAPPY